MTRNVRCFTSLATALMCAAACHAAEIKTAALKPADLAYRNGYIYTVDNNDSVKQSIAVRAGKIVYVGDDAGLAPYIGEHTSLMDLRGRMLMPGLVDGHMHPLEGGAALLKCNLNYRRLTVDELQASVQRCLDQSVGQEPDGWLEVVGWFQEAMLPAGTIANHTVLDSLKTKRPIFIMSSFGHTALVNSRALDIAGITASTAEPLGGKIAHDAAGRPTGLLEDSAHELVLQHIPAATPTDNIKSARAALEALRRQGVTTFMDAMVTEPTLTAFAAVQHETGLSARAHFALLITPPEGKDPAAVLTKIAALRKRFDEGAVSARPSMTVRNVKLFLDGVISAPALTGAMLEPYFAPTAATANAAWVPSQNRGPDVYFPAPVLATLLVAVAKAGFEPHMHADGDRAVREGLDGAAAVRTALPKRDIRIAMAHDEIADPRDFSRFGSLNVIPVLSFQWEKPAPDTIDNAQDYLGAARFKFMEPAGVLIKAGARVAYGSDWPVDALDEWFALKVGVTRANSPEAGPKYAGRLSDDAGLTRAQALRAITMNSSYQLHQEPFTGSLEVGKLADLIVLDRNVLQVPAEQIAGTKVLQTVVGGKIVYSADESGAQDLGKQR